MNHSASSVNIRHTQFMSVVLCTIHTCCTAEMLIWPLVFIFNLLIKCSICLLISYDVLKMAIYIVHIRLIINLSTPACAFGQSSNPLTIFDLVTATHMSHTECISIIMMDALLSALNGPRVITYSCTEQLELLHLSNILGYCIRTMIV